MPSQRESRATEARAGGAAASPSQHEFSLLPKELARMPQNPDFITSFTILQAEAERLGAAKPRNADEQSEISALQTAVDRRIQAMFADRDAGTLTPIVYTRGLLEA